jgi:hypothetical protein
MNLVTFKTHPEKCGKFPRKAGNTIRNFRGETRKKNSSRFRRSHCVRSVFPCEKLQKTKNTFVFALLAVVCEQKQKIGSAKTESKSASFLAELRILVVLVVFLTSHTPTPHISSHISLVLLLLFVLNILL